MTVYYMYLHISLLILTALCDLPALVVKLQCTCSTGLLLLTWGPCLDLG